MLNQLIEERSRWFLWSPVLLGVGVALYFAIDWQPSLNWLSLSVLLSCLFLFRKVRQKLYFFLPILIVLFVSLGFNASIVRQNIIDAPILQKKVVTSVTGEVISKSAGQKKTRLVLDPLSFDRKTLPHLAKIRVTVRGDTSHVHPGQQISLVAVLLPPPPPAYPGAYDFQRNSYFQKIGAVGYAISAVTVLEEGAGRWSQLLQLSARFRDDINVHIATVAPPTTAGFSTAIMTGDKQAMEKKQLENMRQSGLAHILAISGLHMGMVGGLIFFAVRFLASLWPRVALNYPIKKWAAVVALLGLSGYLLVSGVSVSAVRAYLMISLVFIAILFDRTAISLRNLAFAAVLILLFMPESLTTASFQMSFGAVFCLIAVYERFGNTLMILSKSGGFIKRSLFYLGGILFTSLIASFATAPFSIYHFGQFSSLGILANLVAVPVMGLWVMPWTIVSFIVMPFNNTGIPLDIAGAGIVLILEIADLVAHLPGAFLTVGTYPTVFLVGVVLSTLWFLIWRTKMRWAGVVFLIAVLPSLWTSGLPDILYSESGNLFLIRQNNDELLVNTLRADRFERERWSLLYGAKKFQKISKSDVSKTHIKCDRMGCVYNRNGDLIAFSNNWMAVSHDCERAQILISAVPVKKGCESPIVIIDKFDLWRSGTHAFYFDKKGAVTIETVNSVRGDRPWVPARFTETLTKYN